jgi:hypothetical protein
VFANRTEHVFSIFERFIMSTNPSFHSSTGGTSGSAPDLNINTAVVTPVDRVRWPAVIAGLFGALSALFLLSILGIAVGLSAYDAGDDARRFGIGAGIWGIISMIIAFFFGGWLAARSASLRGERTGLMNGALVWAVAIPLLGWVLAGGAARMTETAASVADNDTRQRVNDQVDRVVKASTGNPGETQNTSQQNSQQNMSQQNSQQNANQDREQAAKDGSKAAWGTLVSMLLGLVAAAVGGWTGARERHGYRDRGPEQHGGGSRTYGSNA